MDTTGLTLDTSAPVKDITAVSSSFKQALIKTFLSIMLFVVVYISLVAAACGLAILCGYAGLWMIFTFPRLITIMIGAGLMALGAMVLYFLIKFIFRERTKETPGDILLNARDEPELFAFIQETAKAAGVPFPKKVFLTADVNAAVFYNSTFWSMFLPVKKNLMIGVGLVNMLNVSELCAVLAHEFGHFSQRSMKMGSYIFNFNKIIYNMLYENEDYNSAIQRLASISSYFSFFAGLTVWIVNGIRYLLQKVQYLISLSYSGLSRQMEYHADAVAASVAGSSHVISSLRRIELAGACYQRLLSFYGSCVEKGLKPDNIYPQHLEIINFFGRHFDIPKENGLPMPDAGSAFFLNHSRLVIKDQWASHPTTEEREARLVSYGLEKETNSASAWSLFSNPEKTQQLLSAFLFKEVSYTATPETLTLHSFRDSFYKEVEENSFQEAYKGYYDGRYISSFDPEKLAAAGTAGEGESFESLFEDVYSSLPKIVSAMEEDIETLKHIKEGNTRIRTFDFDGQRYKAKQARDIYSRLGEEMETKRKALASHDEKIFGFFYTKAASRGRGPDFIDSYKKNFAITRESEEDLKLHNRIRAILQPAYAGNLRFLDAHEVASQLKQEEKVLKKRINEIIKDPEFTSLLTGEEQKSMADFPDTLFRYFIEPAFQNHEIQQLNAALNGLLKFRFEKHFRMKKQLFQWQLELSEENINR